MKTITLRCSIPVSFAYEIEVVQPHPYFNIQPLKGVIPADGSINIRVAFDPITLGTCTTVVRLRIAQHNFTPIETVINARAVSGIIENRELIEVENQLAQDLLQTSMKMANDTKVKTMKGSMALAQTTSSSKPPGSKKKGSKQRGVTYRDPVALVLEKTFKATDIGTALTNALPDTHLLGSKVPHINESGITDVIGSKKITQPINPRGVGSGKGVDAGAEWATMHSRKVAERKNRSSVTETVSLPQEEEKVVEGLRIPQKLGSVAAVNFVLTQEIGKLKPKDLKIAIEKNRAERKLQAEEQQKIRDEGGSGTGGELDLRAVLADEKLNLEKGDPFKRQLREMAFLADVEEVQKMEIEKGFRVSEEFLGSSMLSEEDIQIVRDQRKTLKQHRARTDWRMSHKRMTKEHFLPLSEVVRAGAPVIEERLTEDNTPQETPLPSSFDTNKNDIWSKRMHSLRRLISFVSKFIVQQRVMKRYHGLMDRFKDFGVVDVESAKAFVAADAAAIHLPPAPKKKQGNTRIHDKSDNLEDYTLAQVICSMPNQALEKRQLAEKACFSTYNFNKNMTRRVLFPKFIIDEGSTRKKIPPVSIDDPMGFDDRTFFQLKTRADFIDMHYHTEDVPPPPVYFMPADSTYLPRQIGAAEEKLIRPAADLDMTTEDVSALAEEDALFSLSKFPLPPPSGLFGVTSQQDAEHKSQVQFESNEQEDEDRLLQERGGRYEDATLRLESELHSAPAWLTDTRVLQPGQYHLEPSADPDVYRTRPEFRTYLSQLDSKEIDPDYDLRPGKILQYEPDSSFRTELLSKPGFLSAHTYLLGSYASRIRDKLPPPGPTITNFYMPDQDRHPSGLFCFAQDHTRGTMDPDPEVTPLQSRLAREDYLTDSESDDEDGYASEVVTLASVRALLRAHKPPPEVAVEEEKAKPAKGGKKGAKTPVPEPKVDPPPDVEVKVDEDDFSVLDEEKKKHDQVELIRDRKMLDYNLFINNAKKTKMDSFTDKLKIISESCACPLQALEVQIPLHQYEDELLGILEEQAPALSNSFVEQDLSASRSMSPMKELR